MFSKRFYTTLISQIVAALPGGWETSPEGHGRVLAVRPPRYHEQLIFTVLKAERRLEVRGFLGEWHHLHDGRNGPSLQITVAATRSPASIARDIERRLLPGYRAALAAAQERAAQSAARAQREREMAVQLAAGLGGAASVYADDPKSFGGYPQVGDPAGVPHPYVRGHVSGEAVTLHLDSLTLAQAQRIIAALQAD